MANKVIKTLKKVGKEINDFAHNRSKFQKQPPKGKTYLRGRLINMPIKKK